MTTGLVHDDRFLQHETGPGHPERPERLRAIHRALEAAGLLERCEMIACDPADRRAIERVHEPAYIDRVVAACAAHQPYIDAPDSAICSRSADVAMLAVGGVLNAVDAVIAGEVSNAFCAVRPPGHHAERDRSMGFCLFNNVAIAAAHLIKAHSLDRVAIVDVDVHHGNGTQHIFEDRADVLFVSLHEDPRVQYPGTGFAGERGIGEGAGFTLNVPMPQGSGDEAFERAFSAEVLPALDAYQPQFLLVSAGFDAAANDPLGNLRVTSDGFARMARRLGEASGRHGHGRWVSVLEGGYDLDALGDGVSQWIEVMLGAA